MELKMTVTIMNKLYVVWKGRKTGIFWSWEDCKAQIDKFQGARYKSFPSYEAAQEAWKAEQEQQTALGKAPALGAIVVDGACSLQKGGQMEYQAVVLTEGGYEPLFHAGPYPEGTNNVAEFLAIVHAYGYCKAQGITNQVIYSDSVTAMAWVKKGKPNSTPKKPLGSRIQALLLRATNWLSENRIWVKENTTLAKWETDEWGENAADFGRK